MSLLKTTAYLILEASFNRYNKHRVDSVRVVAVRAKKPKLSNTQFAIRVQVAIPSSIFERLIPTVELEVRPDQVVEPEAAVLDPVLDPAEAPA